MGCVSMGCIYLNADAGIYAAIMAGIQSSENNTSVVFLTAKDTFLLMMPGVQQLCDKLYTAPQ